MKYIIICLSILVLVSCNGLNPAKKVAEHRKPEVSTLFDDINLYTLAGIRPLPANAMFPYIDIRETDANTRRVVYQRAPGDSTERIYKKENGYWTTHYRSVEGDKTTSTWEFINPDKITELEYTMTKQRDEYLLTAVSLYSKDKAVTYIPDPKKKITFNPVATALDSIQHTISTMYLEDQQIKDGILTVIDTEVDGKTKQTVKADTIQWKVGNHSWFWWRQMYTLAEKIK